MFSYARFALIAFWILTTRACAVRSIFSRRPFDLRRVLARRFVGLLLIGRMLAAFLRLRIRRPFPVGLEMVFSCAPGIS